MAAILFREKWVKHGIEDKWCIYGSVYWVIIGSGHGLSLVGCQGITWTNAEYGELGQFGINVLSEWN